MTLDELNKKLDNTIAQYNEQSGAACTYCNDEDCATSSALNASHQATSKVLASFKAEILTYLSQLQP